MHQKDVCGVKALARGIARPVELILATHIVVTVVLVKQAVLDMTTAANE